MLRHRPRLRRSCLQLSPRLVSGKEGVGPKLLPRLRAKGHGHRHEQCCPRFRVRLADRHHNGERRQLAVKVGDSVVYSKYGGTEFKLEGETVMILDEDQIYAIKA